jgi:NTE family protein
MSSFTAESGDAVSKALVLGGGGVAGIAWEIGVLQGIGENVDAFESRILDTDVVVGTSAGSSVAAQITSGLSFRELFEAQLDENTQEMLIEFDQDEFVTRLAAASSGPGGEVERRRRIGTFALNAVTVDESRRRTVVAARVPIDRWPETNLLIPAVNATSGELVVFTRASGVGLVDAVTASCAVPGIWPPATIGGSRFIDGGVRSGTNADLASGCERVLILTPTLPGVGPSWEGLENEIASLKPAEILTIFADQSSINAFGSNPLSPATRRAAALAGREVGMDVARSIASFWR